MNQVADVGNSPLGSVGNIVDFYPGGLQLMKILALDLNRDFNLGFFASFNDVSKPITVISSREIVV